MTQPRGTITIPQAVQKLPKWAQNHIRMLEQNLARAERQRDEVFGTKPSNTFIRRGIDEYKYLPDGSRVTFDLGANGQITVQVDHGHRGPVLRFWGMSPVSIHPSASNSVTMTAKESP